MPNIWYHHPKHSDVRYFEENKVKERYRVKESKFINSYHYHGSWFEYTWELNVENEHVKATTLKLCTWNSYKDLANKEIEYDGRLFVVVD